MNASDPEQVFLQEAQDLLEQLEQSLLDLERTPGDGELIGKAFRALHTIKGSGAMFGFDAVAAFTHQFETAFDLVRKGQVTPTRELIAVALAAKDQMRALIDQPAQASAIASELILGDLQRVMAAAPGSPLETPGRISEGSGRMVPAPVRPERRRRCGHLVHSVPATRGCHGDRDQSAASAGRTAHARHGIGKRLDRWGAPD